MDVLVLLALTAVMCAPYVWDADARRRAWESLWRVVR